MKPNNLIYLNCTSVEFYRMWVEFLTPFHKLTAREKDVAARILMQYFRFKDSVPDPEVLKELLWSRNSRKDIMDSLKMSQAHFQMVIAKLKGAGFLLPDGDIEKKYIPHKTEGDVRFMLQIVFDWSSKTSPIKHGSEQA